MAKSKSVVTMKGKDVPRLCGGCGKSTEHPLMHSDLYEIAPGTSVPLCGGRRYKEPSVACLGKALVNHKLCAGCGKNRVAPGRLCDDCRVSLAKGKEQVTRELEVWGINATALGPYLSSLDNGVGGGWSTPMEDLAKLLGEAITAGRVMSGRFLRHGEDLHRDDVKGIFPNVPTGMHNAVIYVELAAGQSEALHKLCVALRNAMRLQYENGWKDGDDMLKRLASGEKGIREYSERRSQGSLTATQKLDEKEEEEIE